MDVSFLERMVVDPKVMAGKHVIKGTRVQVGATIHRVARGETVDEILEEYPRMTRRDLRAALEYGRRDRPPSALGSFRHGWASPVKRGSGLHRCRGGRGLTPGGGASSPVPSVTSLASPLSSDSISFPSSAGSTPTVAAFLSRTSMNSLRERPAARDALQRETFPARNLSTASSTFADVALGMLPILSESMHERYAGGRLGGVELPIHGTETATNWNPSGI
ncbi:MAG: DUF433 domain-containing protein [Nitrososphaerota archaeon]|nr:DUF433 domain-containing protein [Nitrososphaerota archaeon]